MNLEMILKSLDGLSDEQLNEIVAAIEVELRERDEDEAHAQDYAKTQRLLMNDW